MEIRELDETDYRDIAIGDVDNPVEETFETQIENRIEEVYHASDKISRPSGNVSVTLTLYMGADNDSVISELVDIWEINAEEVVYFDAGLNSHGRELHITFMKN